MKKNAQNIHHIEQTPRRVASRMEGVVKNIGIKPIKKQKKGSVKLAPNNTGSTETTPK